MQIKVLTKHYNWMRIDHQLKRVFDTNMQDWVFTFEKGIVSIKGWQKPVTNLEECFKAIVSYFHGLNYEIVDFLKCE